MAKEPLVSKGPPGGTKKPTTGASPRTEPTPAAGSKLPAAKSKPGNTAASKPVKTAPPPAIEEKVAAKKKDTDAPPVADVTQPLMQETMNLDPAQVAPEPEPESDPNGTPEEAKEASVLGDYKLVKKLGEGGMGAVYKGQHAAENRVVAVKVLAKALVKKKEYVLRFQREAKAMLKLDHPNVLRCFETNEYKGHHYIVLEYIDGGSVEGWLKKLGRFSVGDAMHIVLKTAAALQHAHEKSLIHRDIKPDNLLLTKDGVLKVADLGLAKDTDEDVSLTKSGTGAGTPIYMAPEQAYNVKHVDCRVDIYALGVMLYVFLTGHPPFAGTTPIELIMAKEKGKFDPMRKHNDEVPGKLDLIVDKMLAKDPKHRYASCAEVIAEMEPLGLANEQLSFLELEPKKPAVKRDAKPAQAKAPAKPAPKAAGTKTPSSPAAKTNVEEAVEKDVWYWNMVTQSGKISMKKVTTEQLRTLIKAGHIDAEAQVSKTPKAGYRSVATFTEFQAVFQAKKTTGTANVKGQKYRELYKDIEAADARRRRWGWLGKMFKGTGKTIFGLLWIVLILAVVGGGGYFLYSAYIAR